MFCVGGCYTKLCKQGKNYIVEDERRFAAPLIIRFEACPFRLPGLIGPRASRNAAIGDPRSMAAANS